MPRFVPCSLVAVLLGLVGCGGASSDPTSDPSAAPALPTAKTLTRSTPDAARGLPRGAVRAQRVAVMDSTGFAQPIPAIFGLVPVGWRSQGGVEWGQQYVCTNGYNIRWAAQSPDGLQTVAILPQQKWESNNYGARPSGLGCPAWSIGSMPQYLAALVPTLKPGASAGAFHPRPDLAARFQHLVQNTPTATGDMRTWIEAGEVEFAYTEQGRPMRGIAVATGAFSQMRNAALGNGQVMMAFTGFVFPGFAASAPAETFDAHAAEAIRQSFLTNPAWQGLIARHNSAISRVEQEEIRKQSQAITEYNDYVSMIRRQSADLRAASDERNNREFGEGLRGTQSYDDPSAPGGRAELSALYQHAWRLNDGSYVLSDDASFEPFRDLGIDGSRLSQTR